MQFYIIENMEEYKKYKKNLEHSQSNYKKIKSMLEQKNEELKTRRMNWSL